MNFLLKETLQEAHKAVFDLNSSNACTILRHMQSLVSITNVTADCIQLLSGKFGHIAAKFEFMLGAEKSQDKKGTPFELVNIALGAGVYSLRQGNTTPLHWNVWQNYYKNGGVGVMGFEQAKNWARTIGLSNNTRKAICYMHHYRTLVRSYLDALPKSIQGFKEIKAIFKRFLELFSYELFFSLPRY